MSPIDLRSDTVTRPTAAMWEAMKNAELGDDVLGDDPTVIALETLGANMLGKEAAIFTPSGTMANQIAIRLHTQPGDAILMEAGAHPFNYEGAAAAMISSVQIRPIAGVNGILDPAVVNTHFRPPDPHYAPVSLLAVEDTANRGGGTPYPIDVIDSLTSMAKTRGVGGVLLVTADHGNADQMFNLNKRTGEYTDTPCTSHSLNPVPIWFYAPNQTIELTVTTGPTVTGSIAQVGGSILTLFGIAPPTDYLPSLVRA